MQGVGHADGQDNKFSVGYGDSSSIITMLQNMLVRQDDHYEEDVRGEMLLRQLKWRDFVSYKST